MLLVCFIFEVLGVLILISCWWCRNQSWTLVTKKLEDTNWGEYSSVLYSSTKFKWKHVLLCLFKVWLQVNSVIVVHQGHFLLPCLYFQQPLEKSTLSFLTCSRLRWKRSSSNILELLSLLCLPTVGLLVLCSHHHQDFPPIFSSHLFHPRKSIQELHLSFLSQHIVRHRSNYLIREFFSPQHQANIWMKTMNPGV